VQIEVTMKKDKKTGTSRLTITVPYEELKAYRDKAVGIHAKEGEVPGFRKGKAPMPRVIAHFSKEVIDEFALRLFACEAVEQALKEKKAKAAGKVRIDLPEVKEDKEIKFTSTFAPAEKDDEGDPELPWPRVGHLDADDDERPYGKPPMYLKR
jgi:trigger factor